MKSNRSIFTAGQLLLGCALAFPLPLLAQGAHVHGLVHLDVAVDAKTLTIALESPLDSLLGFEHRPRTAAQRKAAADVLARMNDGASLFRPDAAAQCTPTKTAVQAEVLQAEPAGAKHGKHEEHGKGDKHGTHPKHEEHAKDGKHAHDKHGKGDKHEDHEEHAELGATYEYTCQQPDKLTAVEIGLFDAFKRIRSIEVQVAGAQGQSKHTLKPTDKVLRLTGR